LDEAVDGLHEAVGDLEPAQDAVPVALDGLCGLDDRGQPTVSGPEIPFLEVGFRILSGRLAVKVLEGKADPVGPGGLQVGVGEIVEGIGLGAGEVFLSQM